jgi:hypothetical protein
MANGLFDFDTVVPISQFVYNYSRTPGETNVALSRSRTYTVDMLLDVVIVMSAGGATAALAELISGTTFNFHRLMNAKAAEWGIDAVFRSVSGGVQHTLMTPRAMAEITRRTIQDFPEVLEKTAMESVNWFGYTIQATNRLLGVYEGMDGFKTGTHTGTRANFSGTAKRGDIRIIIVTMGSGFTRRFDDSTILLNYGFAVMEEIESRKVTLRNTPVLVNGEEIEFGLFYTGGNIYFSLRDIAYVLSGTMSQFNVESDEESGAIMLTSGTPYTPVGGEMYDRDMERWLPEPFAGTVFIDGEEVQLSAYDIDGASYFHLNEIGDAFDFEVVWRRTGDSRTLNIETPVEYVPPEIIEMAPPIIVPVEPDLPVTSTEPDDLTEPEQSFEPGNSANEEVTPIPFPIVLGVVGGLCIIGGILGLRKLKGKRTKTEP